jgi:integrase
MAKRTIRVLKILAPTPALAKRPSGSDFILCQWHSLSAEFTGLLDRRTEAKSRSGCHSATAKYVIEGARVNGKRRRYFFPTKEKAEAELGRMKIKQRKEGENALKLPDSLRIMALECAQELKPLGKTLKDATQFYIEYLRDAERSISVSALIDEYLAGQQRLNRSQAHIYDLRQRLSRFKETFGGRPLRTVTTNDIDAWLHDLDLSAQSVNNYRSRIAALFSYGLKREYVERNPVSSVDKIKLIDEAPEIFAPEQIQNLLNSAPSDLLPCLALCAFAGLRTAEMLRMEWDAIDLPRGLINVSASNSKTAKRRLIEIAPNLAEWLSPYVARSGKVYPHSQRWYHHNVDLLRKAVGLAEWPSNGLRHSFASYHLAKYENAPQLALQMGHTTPRMIFDHYRELVTPAEADLFWKIGPQASSANVITLRSSAL